MTEDAIVVKDARKRYGSGVQILNGLDMTVARGTIYGLLGASGCGKTTLLSCVVGVRKLDSGDIWVLGGHPGTKGSGIPGPRVGYMPQEISLVNEFSVSDSLYYFGRINGLNDEEIEERQVFLSDLLKLPPKNRLVKDMSGGQQRRVSFAAALIHRPELLILDEPTVGLDPVLRDNIWDFLSKITREEGVAVVITTHYIEETKQANKIGLMRSGQLLAEASPNQLLSSFQCDTLEGAFLILSKRQKDYQDRGIVSNHDDFVPELREIRAASTDYVDDPYSNNNEPKESKKYHRMWDHNVNKRVLNPRGSTKFRALMIKNILQFIRHPGGILFALVFPLIQIATFFGAIGRDPKSLTMAIVNLEANNCRNGNYRGEIIYDEYDFEKCDYIDLSCRFLHGFNDTLFDKEYYDDLNSAQDAVMNGNAVGTMHFGKNFSWAFQKRQDEEKMDNEVEILMSEIQIWLDMSNRQIGLHLKKKLYERYFEIYRDILKECHLAPKIADMPVRFEEPIFGTMNQSYSSFMAPVFILTLVFFLATSVSSSIIITDRYEGVWDRSLVQGVTTAQILMAHLCTQVGVIVIQCVVALTMSFVPFELECKGSFPAAAIMVFLMGVCGMCYGFLISILCSTHTMANYVTTGSFYPVLLLCGCLWPIEGMPKGLQWLGFSMPTTIPGIALRALLTKGFNIDDSEVYPGFLVVSGWTTILVLLCLVGLKFKSS